MAHSPEPNEPPGHLRLRSCKRCWPGSSTAFLHQFRAEENEPDSVLLQRSTVLPPVSIRGVKEFRPCPARPRNGDKFAIRTIKCTELRISREFRKSPDSMERYGYFTAMPKVPLVLPQPFEEGVSQARLPRVAEALAVFLNNQPLVVQKRSAPGLYLLKRPYAGRFTLRPCLLRPEICRDRHV